MRPLSRAEAASTAELENQVFTYYPSYFRTLGEDHADVVEFRRLVEQRDLLGLRRNWGRLQESFLRLERAAGHCDRPLIMDFYFGTSEALVELCKRHFRAMPTDVLEAAVFRFDKEYFRQFPTDDPDVETFRNLVEHRELAGLRRDWARLADAFERLEQGVHPRTQVRFQEAYHLHFVMLIELCERRKSG